MSEIVHAHVNGDCPNVPLCPLCVAEADEEKLEKKMGKIEVTVPVKVVVDEGDYDLNYGRTDDIREYTTEIVTEAARVHMERLGWGQVQE